MAISTTKIDLDAERRAFVTLSFAGDDLDPAEISAIMPIEPTRAHRKGEFYISGKRAGRLRGRTGMWHVATDKLVRSDDLQDHLRFVEKLLYPRAAGVALVQKLRDVLGKSRARARLTCFWRGDGGEPPPEIPADFRSALAPLAAVIETDFG